MFFEKEITFDRFIRLLIAIGIIFGIFFLLDYFSSVLIPFVIALTIAYFMNPFINFIQKFVKNRAIAVLLGVLIIFGVFIGIGFLLVPMIASEIKHAGDLIKELLTNTDWQNQIDKYLPAEWAKKLKDFISSGDIQKLLDQKQLNDLTNFGIRKVLPGLGNILGYTFEVLIGLFGMAIIILYLFFILLDYNEVNTLGKSLIPPKYKNKVLKFSNDFEMAMNNYFRAQALIASIVGVLFAIGFTIIGLPMGIVLGLFIGVLNLIPYLQNIAIIPALFLAMLKSLETGQNFWVVFGLVILVFFVVQEIQDWVLTPKIMGDATGLNPAIILLSLSLWGKMLGILGLLIALPMTYLMLSYYKRLISKTNKKEGPGQIKTEFDLISDNLRKLPGEID